MIKRANENLLPDAIQQLNYSELEVLSEVTEIQLRKRMLYRGMILGNSYRSDTEIVFETESGTKSISSTVWAVTENHVVLKGGMFIPINCIKEVNI